MTEPWLLVSSVIMVDRRKMNAAALGAFTRAVDSAAKKVDDTISGHQWLSVVPMRSSWKKDGRSVDIVITVDEFEEISVIYKPRGIIMYELEIPLATALHETASGTAAPFLESLFVQCCEDAARRWKTDLHLFRQG